MSKRWQQQERKLAETPGVRRTPQSGAGVRKGDALGTTFCVSCKTTTKLQFALKLAEIRKMMLDASTEGLAPIMQVEFEHADLRLAVLPWAALEELLEAAGVSL